MTYSIVARDPVSGAIGAAAFTGSPFVGGKVLWSKPGVGAVATQGRTRSAYGPAGLELLQDGRDPRNALKELLDSDPHREERQIALLDRRGNIAVHTGSITIREAGHLERDGFGVQANMMANPNVWEYSAQAYERAEGSLAEGLMAAMEEVHQRGGDLRGAQSCAMRVVSGNAASSMSHGVVLDLRVDAHPQPLQEMRRLLKKHKAFEAANKAAQMAGNGDIEGAFDEYQRAVSLDPEELQLRIWGWVPLILADQSGKLDRVASLLKPMFRADEKWVRLVERYLEVRPLRTPGLMGQVLALAGPKNALSDL